jgi:hypothetical protein
MKLYMEKKTEMEKKLQFFVKQSKIEICITDVVDGAIKFTISGPKIEFERAERNLSTFKSIARTSDSSHDEELAETFGYYQLNFKVT